MTLTYTDAIVDFNPFLIGSSLKSKYILFENKDAGYDHLGISFDKNDKAYVETFFYNPNDIYIKNQKVIKVKNAKIYDKHGKIYLEDSFIPTEKALEKTFNSDGTRK